jgi:peptide deformylase
MKEFSGFPAIIIQHEMDHLNGILFTKRVMEQNEKLFKSHKNADGEDEFEEIKI